MNPRTFSLAADYEKAIERELLKRGHSLEKPKPLADAVLKLSDHYTQNPQASTPWDEQWAQIASLAYYFPLNYARNSAVAEEGHRLGFFNGLTTVVDIGSGMGAGLFAFQDSIPFARSLALDIDSHALEMGQHLRAQNQQSHKTQAISSFQSSSKLGPGHDFEPSSQLLTASYVWTEFQDIPAWWLESEAMAIVEPSTASDSRRLMGLRDQLVERGYHIWAPCTHTEHCPMLAHSLRDWCHDRIHWNAPAWWTAMEKYLPMKNRTLTYSYLLARKSLPAPERLRALGRLTGDMLIEKGKTRQSLCRSSEREFLAWFPQRMRKGDLISLERGSLVELNANLEKKSDEVRLTDSNQVRELSSDEL
jgi:ribosomal protein RSM22 (predicted rRNA methylase)